jgi:hypothetical protein
MSAEPNPEARQDRRHRLLYICDWLPPDFGAVGQYSEIFARQLAQSGRDVVLGGLSSQGDSETREDFFEGSLTKIKLHAQRYDKGKFTRRLSWTIRTNTRLLVSLRRYMRWTDEILFTGSPPLFLHWIAPANVLLRKKLIYRITDFHPECAIAERGSPSLLLNILYRATLFWRRRVEEFEVLGNDQMGRLVEIGISPARIRLKADPSPVSITTNTAPLPRPPEAMGKCLILYSGNWGIAHDYRTFIDGYTAHHRNGSGKVFLWLNAVGAGADKVANLLTDQRLPFLRGMPVPLERLASLLVTPDVHLISLCDAFVGYVLPSKVHGCVASGRPVLFIGSQRSDVHRVCTENMRALYIRTDVGDGVGVARALERLAMCVEMIRAPR